MERPKYGVEASERSDRARSNRVETARAGFIIGSTAMRIDCAAISKMH